ncbi:peptidase M15B and M15C, D,D-carboxypeptidase VanY/endolysins [Acidothermus cellulolyticus 11B]|uniref:Peptidase M15B and M15C, D,D-carboxypeptidase VanY/endolysins n=1 Tax=Acidothermus cellulolyticus (strain ATCC 43068 / DSM 8971 / 11B) TaxID=351607 RepID=A0LSF0_ACIC1|nr:peptidase M15B and M15C, D,D-carboxypeptidase VanY/endolysins [Acidothermus cellulolyticus 11B]
MLRLSIARGPAFTKLPRSRRTVTALAVTVMVVAGSAIAAGPALAQDSGQAPTAAQLAAIRKLAAAAQAELAAGARRLDAAQARQRQLAAQAAAATAQARRAEQRLAALQEQIAGFAGSMYEHPTSDVVTEVIAGGDLQRALQATTLLTIASGSHLAVLREASATRTELAQAQLRAAQAAAAAAAVQASIQRQVAALRDAAAKAAQRLEAAQKAYAAEQARIAAARAAAARAAAEKAARERAAREAALRDAIVAPPPCDVQGPYPPGPWGGYANGLIPASALCPIIGGGLLRPDAAVAFNRMTQAYRQAFGTYLCVNASYRPYADQVRLFRIQPSLSAVPGTSNHGWGEAVDLGCGVQNYGSPQFRWMVAHAGEFGWVHPAWANHSPFEPWHWEFGYISDGDTGT